MGAKENYLGHSERRRAFINDTADRNRTEEALRRSEERYRTLFDSIDEGFCVIEMIFDGAGRPVDYLFLEINPAFEKQTGLAGATGKRIRELAPEHEAHWFEIYGEIALTGRPGRFEREAVALGRWFALYAFRVGEPEKRRVAVLFTDITERKRQEIALRESAERIERQSRIFDTTLSSITDFAYIFDKEGRFLYSNQALINLLGITFDEIVGKNFFDLNYPPDLAERLQRQIQEVIETKERVIDETLYVSPSGVAGYYEYIFSPVIAADGSVEVVAGSTRDITAHKQIQKALQASEEQSRNILESITDAFVALDPAWRFTYVNRQAERLLGDASGLLGKVLWEIYPGLIGTEFERAYRRAAEERVPTTVTSFYPDHNRWYEVYAYPAPSGITLYFRNVTKRMEADAALRESEERLRRQAAELEKINRVKDDFLATLSHELRTPLNAILGWATLLRTQKFDANTTGIALETIERNARAQNKLIEDILDVSRIIMGKLRLEITEVEFIPIIQSAADTLRPAAEAKGVDVILSLDPPGNILFGDASRLQQVVWNLLSNAVKFTSPGGRVEVRLEKRGLEIALQVKDNGSGIDPAFLPFVFERFRQADSASNRSHGGLGLGLAIVRHLVELHGGTVRAESPGKGAGATFVVVLPVRPAVPSHGDETDEGSSGAGRRAANLPELDGVKVLVVDDEPDARNILRILLEQCGAVVTTAETAEAGLSAFGRSRPDVIVSDIGMPGEDGYALIRKIRLMEGERPDRVPAVALTAYVREEDRARILSAGYQLHMPKPIEPEQLAGAIRRMARGQG